MPRGNPPLALLGSGDEDRDDVSVTSTAPSEAQDEYLVEEILAERSDTSTTLYLVKWDGYPEERCTWEPRSSFQADDEPEGPALLEWRTRKMRLDRGLEKPYDVETLEIKVEAIQDAKLERKDRRWAKRKRLGIPVPALKPSQQLTDPLSDDEPVGDDDSKSSRSKAKTDVYEAESSSPSENDGSDAVRTRRRVHWTDQEDNALMKGLDRIGPYWDQIRETYPVLELKSKLDLEREARRLRSTFVESGRDVPWCLQFLDNKRPKAKRTRKHDGNESSEDSLMEDIQTQAFNKTHKKLQKRGKPNNVEEPTEDINNFDQMRLTERQKTIKNPPLKPTVTNPSQPAVQRKTQMGRAGTGPAGHGGIAINSTGINSKRPPIQGADIFGKWDQARTRKPYGTGKPGGSSKFFNNLSTQNRAAKARRREPAPNPANLSFVDTQTGRAIKNPISSANSQAAKKTPFQLLQEQRRNAEANELAVDADAGTPAEDLDEDTLMMIDSITAKDQTTKVQTRENNPVSIVAGPTNQSRVLTGPAAENFPLASPLISSTALHAPTKATAKSPRDSASSTAAKAILPTNRDRISSLNAAFMSRERQMAAPVPAAPVPEPRQDINDQAAPEIGTPYPKDILGLLEVGPQHEIIGEVRFRGIPELPYHPQFKTLVHPRNMLYSMPKAQSTGRTHYWFEHICIADYYRKYFPWEASDVLASGQIVPFPQTATRVAEVADTLEMHVSGGVLFAKDFSMLIYPTGTEEWQFLDETMPVVPAGTRLNFMMRKPSPGFDPTTITPSTRTIDASELSENNTANVFKFFFKMNLARIIPSLDPRNSLDPKKEYSVFLMFHSDPKYKEEHDFLQETLSQNNATIYSSQTPGAWDYFVHNVEDGTILIHISLEQQLHKLPWLYRTTRGHLNHFFISLQPHLSHVHPETSPELTRIFPHGGALCLTDSLFLLRPYDAFVILTWFRDHIIKTKPDGIWKVLVRPRIRNFLLDVANDRPLMSDRQIYVDIFSVIWDLLPLEMMEGEDLEEPKDGAHVVCMFRGLKAYNESVGYTISTMTEDDIRKNDEVIIDYFAGWSRLAVDEHRKFHVVMGREFSDEERKAWGKEWTHFQVLTAEATKKFYGIDKWEEVEKPQEKLVMENEAARVRMEAREKEEAEEERVKAGQGGRARAEMSERRD